MTVEPFAFGLDTTVSFGVGRRAEVGRIAAAFGERAALVTGAHSLAAGPHGAEIENALRAAGVEAVVRCQVTAEPELGSVLAAADAFREHGATVVVAVGGGSVIDLAKAAAVSAHSVLDAEQLATGPRFDSPVGLPVVALPTTAGSGAEVSRGAIVTDPDTGRKHGIRGRGVAARAAIVDPELAVGCPPRVTARAGFDAVAHAVETTISRAASPVTRTLAWEALPRLLDAVPRAMAQPGDLAARSAAAYAAMLMGVNLANSTTCLPHRMQYPLGSVAHSEHATGVAALTPAWLDRVLRHAPERLATFAAGIGSAARDEGDAAAAVAASVLSFMERIDLQPRLRDLGIRREDLPRLAGMVEGTLENDPGPTDPDALTALYEASW
ncbi:MAG TPA: iron-containing alcohol dehydrogenase [Candidatus Limnocylindria bacterium]|jgi:alcohol dehydrogenase class IV